jgi:hypothetical protein
VIEELVKLFGNSWDYPRRVWLAGQTLPEGWRWWVRW